ncbi:MAG: DUF998 domain-containing protein [Natrialbaceae archaeon]|nr:DUF998 domain-containing protein [Natrialbaceae archaeon]
MTSFDTTDDPLRSLLTACGILAPLAAFIAIAASTWIHRAWFTWANHALSDLGALGTDHFWIYNVGLLATGTFGILFAARLLDYFRSRISQAGTIVFSLGMFSLAMVGAFPGGVQYHMRATNLFFGLCTIGVLIVGIGESLERDVLGYALLVVVAMTGIFAYLTTQWFSGAAIPELVGAIAYTIFSLLYVARLTGRLPDPDGRGEPSITEAATPEQPAE